MKTPAFVVRAAIAAIALLILGITLTIANASPPQAIPADTTAAPTAPYCWTDVVPPSFATGDVALNDIEAISANDIWAVGDYANGPTGAVALHWNGTQWTSIALPALSYRYTLHVLTALSSNNVWAAGSTAFLHWDGAQWASLPTPAVPNVIYMSDIIAADSTTLFATLTSTCAEGECGAGIVRWNGTEWSTSTSVYCGGGCNTNFFHRIALNDIRMIYPLGMRSWDGTSWQFIDNPFGGIASMASTSATDIWASDWGHLKHWDGTSVTSYPSLGVNDIHEMVALAPNDVWAVGNNGYLHWDGTEWELAGNPQFQTNVSAITAVDTDNLWAVGNTVRPNYHGMMISHYSPTCVATPQPTRTATNTPTITPTPTATNTPVPPRCPGERFTDVCPGDYFYQHVLALNDASIISGYNTSPPCDGQINIPCFKPYNFTTRGQVSKIISLAAGFNEPVSSQSFEDVPPSSTFYEYIERMAIREIIIGYPCGIDSNEPCGPENRPYFRPGAELNRAQLSKMTALAFDFNDVPEVQTFEDVVPGNHFYPFIENLASRSIINGYACGGPDEPCIPPGNRPYFHYGARITRGQIAKIVNLARIYPAPTPTSTRTPRPTHTPGTPFPTPTCAPNLKGWISGPDLPVTLARAFGVYFPPNGKFYAFGGRRGEFDPNLAQRNPLEYDPTAHTWTTKTASFSNNNTSNVQGGVVIMAGTPVIVLVGGSAGGGTTGTPETRIYNPVTDTMTTLASDPWKTGSSTVPGGAAVVDNRLYILGGFVIGTGMSSEIWEFDPDAAPTTRWTRLPVSLNEPLGYIPTTVIGNKIYMAGGSRWSSGDLVDTKNAYSFDPATYALVSRATMPRITGETKAVNMGGKMWVLGGGRVAPNPSSEVNIYDPATNTWSTGLPFNIPRRNFPADTDGAGNIYLAGGYDVNAVEPYANMEIYNALNFCGTITPTLTPTAGTPSPTPSPTPNCTSNTWTTGQSLPAPITHAFGSYYPYNNKFYSLGGRAGDDPNLVQRLPLEYDPSANTWITKTSGFGDNNTSDIQGGILDYNGPDRITLIGGNAPNGTSGTTEVRAYQAPADEMWTVLFPWGPGITTLPGGAAVVNNRLYIFGGYKFGQTPSSEIWEFDINAGYRWTLLSTALPEPLAFIPTTAVGNKIYLAGGSKWNGAAFVDSDSAYVFDTTTYSISPITSMPRKTSNTAAVTVDNKMWVLGGGIDDPTRANEVDIYDPTSNSWTLGTPFATPRRNFAAAADPAGNVYIAGGYKADGSGPTASMEISHLTNTCGTPAPPTATPTTPSRNATPPKLPQPPSS